MSATAPRGSGHQWQAVPSALVPGAGRPAKVEATPNQAGPANAAGAPADTSAAAADETSAETAVETTAVAPPETSTETTLRRRLLRLALDVHDGPMQNLAVIGFSLGDLRRRMQAVVPPEHHTNLDAGMETISEELVRVESELRALIGALEQGGRTAVPLIEAIQGEIREFERRSVVKVTFTHDGEIRTETDSQRIALESVTRAALANIAKHAAANTVKIELHGDSDSITLVIEDDGRGFKMNGKPKPGRFGLIGMRERVELLGGEFKLESRPGGPTTITARLHAWRPPSVE